MDKYTVDLDQVLNDFEYSELTDQHSKNVSERAPSNIPFQPPPVTKHSINNVFHSLNEYLNSGINDGNVGTSLKEGGCLQEKQGLNDNKLDYNLGPDFNKDKERQNNKNKNIINTPEHSFEGIDQNQQLKFKGEADTNVNLENNIEESASNRANTDNLLGENVNQSNLEEMSPNLVEHTNNINEDEIPKTLTEEISLISDTFEKTDVDSIKTETPNFPISEAGEVEGQFLPELNCKKSFIKEESNNVNNDLECDSSVLDKADSVLGKDEASLNNCLENIGGEADVSSAEIVDSKNATDILVDIEGDSIENVNTQTKLEDFVIEAAESPYAMGELDATVQEKEESTTQKDIQPVDEVKIGEVNENAYLIVENNIATVGNNDVKQDPASLESSLTEPLDNAEGGVEENVAPQKIIGFSADIDIDENELNKMLEDLELEGEEDEPIEKVTQNNAVELSEANEEHIEKISVENCVQESDGNDNEVAASQIEEDKDDRQIVSSEPKPDVPSEIAPNECECIEETKPKPTEESHPQVIECLEMEKPRKKKKSSTNASASEHSNDSITTIQHTKDVLEEQSENVEQEVKNEVLSPEKGQSQECVARPQNLPLNNEVNDENIGRKINLIGSPGSTPYNNVYINKSIEPKTTQDIDSDYTSSASPTFSDCSTESTSTASTVSVENVPNNADKFTKKTSGVKNTNAEGELAQAQGATEGAEKRASDLQQNISEGEFANQNPEGAACIPEVEATNGAENPASNSEAGAGDPQLQSSQSTDTFLDKSWLGKEAPLWIPDADAAACLHCDMKFTVLKRRHHCRACGLVLCSKCCNLKFKLQYLEAEARVCNKCYNILNKDAPNNAALDHNSPETGNSPAFRPNPNNPLEYCSTVSPLQQAGQAGAPPPSVMVPVGVLKRKGSNKKSNKSVMFCDGIAPGSDLTNLDQDFNYNVDSNIAKSIRKEPEEAKKKEESAPPPAVAATAKVTRNQPKIDQETGCFIPKSETSLPPTISVNKTDTLYSDCSNSPSVVEMLKNEPLVFALNQNLFVHVRVINMNCCINKQAWCFCSEGLINVGSDEVVYLIEYIEEESFVPKDVFFHIYNVYMDAIKGTSIKELGLSLHNTSNFLDSRNHAGFVYLKPTFQCLENVIAPKEPFLIGILIHRWETPWAKLFPLRLILRLGAEYRYYPSPLISTRHRDSVFVEIGHTIINLLADFRNFTYTLPQIRGLIIHMEDKKTTITIPKNRYDQVMKSINNSSEHILAFAGNFSPDADSHLVCIQDTQGHENCYTTHAINIHNKPRKTTGASFIVFNGSLKSSSGLTAKSNIVEDGLMIQIPSEHMEKVRDNLRNMKNHTIACGCINATSDETVNIVWGENDVDFNVGVKSAVDLADMKGVPSIRVHNGKDYFCNNGLRLIRWTEVFILQNGEENPKNQDPVDISKVSESIAKASCTALVKYLDLLVSNSCQKIGIRTTLHVENVSYSAGSNGLKLPPIYMRSLDNELVPVLHRITSNNLGDNAIVLELIFRILNA